MSKKLQIGIYGYGNIGKGVESEIANNPDMQLYGIFTRRNPEQINHRAEVPVYDSSEILNHKGKIDVLIICGGSAKDLPEMTPRLAKDFNVVDSFDTHHNIPIHFGNVDKSAKENDNIAIVCCGWDPGFFSINRVYAHAILPKGQDYTFWGKGVSQGHSDAIRNIEGVADARQYTIPVKESMDKVRSCCFPELETGDKHTRLCYVVAKEDTDKAQIEKDIIEMPNYFEEYQTTVHFISQEELDMNHSQMPHGGFVIHTGVTGFGAGDLLDCKDPNRHENVIEYNLKLDSNPEFTASCLLSFARAAHRMRDRGVIGCKTPLDVAPGDMHIESPEFLRKNML